MRESDSIDLTNFLKAVAVRNTFVRVLISTVVTFCSIEAANAASFCVPTKDRRWTHCGGASLSLSLLLLESLSLLLLESLPLEAESLPLEAESLAVVSTGALTGATTGFRVTRGTGL